jgi:predicted acetyltransferase
MHHIGEADIAEVAKVYNLTFGSPTEHAEIWVRDELKIESVRVRRDPFGITAVGARISMGQWFGGQRLATVGITGVAVHPRARGRGEGNALMREAHVEAAADGFVLAGLFASTAMYRAVGYENAGYRCEHAAPLDALSEFRASPRVRHIGMSVSEDVRACYASLAPGWNGALDRTAYLWQRMVSFRGILHEGFEFLDEQGVVDGYAFVHLEKVSPLSTQVRVSDVGFMSVETGRSILGFLANYATMSQRVMLFGGPRHVLASLVPLSKFDVNVTPPWMLRILDLKRALQQRGYSPWIEVDFDLDVIDPLLPDNTGRWRFMLRKGQAVVERSTDHRRCAVRTSISGLVPVFTGLLAAEESRNLGLLEGDADALSQLTAAMTGPAPWMSDAF